MTKKIMCAAMSLFLLLQTWKLLGMVALFHSLSFAIKFLLAWVISLFVTGIFAFAGFGFPTQGLLPDSYYWVSNTKLQKKVYKVLRVDLFRKALLATVWRRKKDQKKFFDGTSAGIAVLGMQSQKSEIGHLFPFILTVAVSIYFLGDGLWLLAILIQLFNIVGNLYPVILQRQHRMRMQILKARMLR